MQLYNTLTRTVALLTPLNQDAVRIYSCGPTVYDHAHIGNLSSYIYADTLRRTIKAAGLNVMHTMNITDVDDKTIRRSLEADHHGSPMNALINFTSRYTELFFADMDAVGNDINAYSFVKATDHIGHMQVIIRNLLDKSIAYIAGDGVYFSIRAYRDSGKTYGQLLKLSGASTAGVRIDNDEYDKASAHDFALWKKRRPDEPYWDFEIDGQDMGGRPGWHIECSAMSAATLGLPFDIHTGGSDLIFPHHENEIAQSTAGVSNDIMATFFVHNEHLLVDGRKMSKSLQNFYTLEDVRAKSIDPLAFRLLVLQSHYRSQSNFTWENLQAAQNILQDIRAWSDMRFQSLNNPGLGALYNNAYTNITAALQQDMNTPEALAGLIAMVKAAGEQGADSAVIAGTLPKIEALFGLGLLDREDIDDSQKQALAARDLARKQNNWELSDDIRSKLLTDGLYIRDTEQGQIWSRS